MGGAGGALGQVLGQAGKLGGALSQSVLKFGIDTAFDIAGGIFGDLAVGNPITLEGVLIGAGIGAAVQISTANLGRLGRFGRRFGRGVEGMETRTFQAGERFGSSVGGRIRRPFGGRVDVPTGSRPDVNVPGGRQGESLDVPGSRTRSGSVEEPTVKPEEPTVKPEETEVKTPETETNSGRTSHFDEPEIEPGVVAKETTADGHEIKVLKDGRVVRCSDCGEIRQKYADLLEQNPILKQRLAEIENISNPQEKAKQAQQFEERLERIESLKIKVEDETLLLGEADFSYAKSLAEQTEGGKRGQITATSYEPLNELAHNAAKGNIETLDNLGVTVQGEVDARQIAQTLGKEGFAQIIWNFPHAKVPRTQTMKFHQQLFDDFFSSAKGVLKEGGQVRVTLVDSPHYRGWHIDQKAELHGFEVVETHRVPYEDIQAAYPGYGHKQTGSDKTALEPDRPTITYVFQKKR